MKKFINVDCVRTGLWLDSNVVYTHIPGWFGHVTRDLKLSVIRHFEGQVNKMPCIIWLCGGGWVALDVNAHLPNFVEIAKSGYVIVSVEYRDSNAVKFPGQLEDVKSAIRYIRANAERYQIDPDKIGIMGESAGGLLAALAGTTGETRIFDKGDNLNYSSSVQAVCPWYAPVDLLKLKQGDGKYVQKDNSKGPNAVDILLGIRPEEDPQAVSRANPITYITENTPPFLLLHGTIDQIVSFSDSEIFYDALEKNGIPVDLISIEGANHADIHFYQQQIMDIILDFFNKYLK